MNFTRYWLDSVYMGEIPNVYSDLYEQTLRNIGGLIEFQPAELGARLPLVDVPDSDPLVLTLDEFEATPEEMFLDVGWAPTPGWYHACTLSFTFEHAGWLPEDLEPQENGRPAYHDLAWCVLKGKSGLPLNRDMLDLIRTRPEGPEDYDSIGRTGIQTKEKTKAQIRPHRLMQFEIEFDLRSRNMVFATGDHSRARIHINGDDVTDRFEVLPSGIHLQLGVKPNEDVRPQDNLPIYGTFKNVRLELTPVA